MSEKKSSEQEVESKELYHFEKLIQGGGINALMYKQIMKSSNRYDKDKVMRAINNKDVDALRKMSRYFYYKSGLYRGLVDYFATMYLMLYKVTPKNSKKFSEKKFTIAHDTVFEYTESLGIEMFADINKVVFAEGAFFGCQREFDEEYTVQQLPTDYCRSLGKYPSGNYVIEFDLQFFNSFRFADDSADHMKIITMYPNYIAKAWADYVKGNRDSQWYQIPEEYGMCFQIDDIGMPMFTGIFVDLIELDNYKKLERIKSALDLVKIIVQKIPLQTDKTTGNISPAFELEDAQAMHSNLTSMLLNNDNVDGYTTPFDTDVLSVQDTTVNSETNSVLKAEKAIFNEAMTSSSLGNAEGNIALTNSIINDSLRVFDIIRQYTAWVDNYINTYLIMSRNYVFRFEILPITGYNRDAWITNYAAGAASGLTKMEYFIVLGIKQCDIKDKLLYERDYLKFDDIVTPLMTAHTLSNDSDSSVGAPEKSETELSPAGITTRETGSNDNRE